LPSSLERRRDDEPRVADRADRHRAEGAVLCLAFDGDAADEDAAAHGDLHGELAALREQRAVGPRLQGPAAGAAELQHILDALLGDAQVLSHRQDLVAVRLGGVDRQGRRHGLCGLLACGDAGLRLAALPLLVLGAHRGGHLALL
jgi:hypothetical protein